VDSAIKIIVKPAIDDTDFKTREEGLTYDQAGIEVTAILEKHDGTVVTTAITPTTGGDYDWAHTDQGAYELELPASGGATFNNTEEGILTVLVYCTGVLPFGSVSYDIVSGAIYDSLVKGTDKLQVDTVEISGDSTAADNAELAFDGTGYGFTNCTVPTVTTTTTATNLTNAPTNGDLTATMKTSVNTEADSALSDYDGPTKAEMDTSFNTVNGTIDDILLDTGTNGVLLAATATSAQLIDDVWDEVLTGAAHNTATSAGRRLREIGAFNITDGTAQAGSAYGITLAAGESATDHIYNRNLIAILDGTGVGQTRTIVDYNGTSKVAVVDRNWWVNPDSTSQYFVMADDTPLVTDHGLAQAGENTTITLRDSASAIDSTYEDQIIQIMAGTGRGQFRLIDSYVGSTKVATIHGTWTTNPDATSVYVMVPGGLSHVVELASDALAQINTECDTALTDYDGPTKSEMDTSFNTVVTDTTAIKAKTDNLPDGIKKNTAITAFTFLMVDSTDHVTGKTGRTVAGSYSGDGGAVASLTNTGAITEISNGLYEIDLTAGELNYSNVTLIFTASDADARIITIHTST